MLPLVPSYPPPPLSAERRSSRGEGSPSRVFFLCSDLGAFVSFSAHTHHTRRAADWLGGLLIAAVGVCSTIYHALGLPLLC